MDPSKPAQALITYSFSAELMEYNRSTGQYQRVSAVQNKEGDVAKNFYVKKVLDNNETASGEFQQDLNSGSFSYTYPAETLVGETSYKDLMLPKWKMKCRSFL